MHRHRLATRAAALCAGLVLSAGLAEVVLRIKNPVSLPVRGRHIVLPVRKRYVARNPSNTKLDPVLTFNANSLGFRGAEPPADFAGALTVLAVGGSTTECRLLNDDKTWCARLSDLLQPRFPDLWLNNAGFDGHSTFGHRLLLDQFVLDLHPDCILFLVGVNDVGRADLGELDRSNSAERASLANRVIEKSELLSTLLVLYRTCKAADLGLMHQWELDPRTAVRADESEESARAFVQEHRERYLAPYADRLRGLVAVTREHGIEPVLITQPALYGDCVDPRTGVDLAPLDFTGRKASTAWTVLELYNDVTRRVGSDTGTLVIDLARKLPKDSALFYDWVHYTNEGARAVAEIVADDLAPLLADPAHTGRRP